MKFLSYRKRQEDSLTRCSSPQNQEYKLTSLLICHTPCIVEADVFTFFTKFLQVASEGSAQWYNSCMSFTNKKCAPGEFRIVWYNVIFATTLHWSPSGFDSVIPVRVRRSLSRPMAHTSRPFVAIDFSPSPSTSFVVAPTLTNAE